MSYPWPSFGAFHFKKSELPIMRTDSGWNAILSATEQRPLGTATSSIVVMAVGSQRRRFECYLAPDRFATLQALLNTTATFTDWDRPTPNSRQAFLRSVVQLDRTPVLESRCAEGVMPNSVRARVELVSQ
ncbi:hypothetical protein LCGC14_2021590 [marine sediment metagenome]|uniref:Uncharacterized protein n=1 Tax=marine sediment metagenome TaxID=412755 RepID=A0A0F9EXH9_9ZZZZ